MIPRIPEFLVHIRRALQKRQPTDRVIISSWDWWHYQIPFEIRRQMLTSVSRQRRMLTPDLKDWLHAPERALTPKFWQGVLDCGVILPETAIAFLKADGRVKVK